MIYHFASVKCCVEYRVLGFGTRYSVPGTRYLALGTQYSALGTRYSALGTQACNLILNTTLNSQNYISCLQWQSCEFWMLSSEYWVPGFGTRYSALGTRHFKHLLLAQVTFQHSQICPSVLQWQSCKFWMSSSEYRVLGFGTQHSVLGTRYSVIWCVRITSLGHFSTVVSSAEYRISNI
jgi:hypothetical protein